MSDFIGRFEFLMDHNYAASSSDSYEENLEQDHVLENLNIFAIVERKKYSWRYSSTCLLSCEDEKRGEFW